MSSAAIFRVVTPPPRLSWVRALLAGALAAGFVGVAAAGHALAAVDVRARCEAERDAAGYGRRAALRALDDPDGQSRFLYRVVPHESGYRAVVVVREGPFTGDAWERDAAGRVRHQSDVCKDRS